MDLSESIVVFFEGQAIGIYNSYGIAFYGNGTISCGIGMTCYICMNFLEALSREATGRLRHF